MMGFFKWKPTSNDTGLPPLKRLDFKPAEEKKKVEMSYEKCKDCPEASVYRGLCGRGTIHCCITGDDLELEGCIQEKKRKAKK